MKSIFFKTDKSFASFVLRLTLGLVVFPHGAQKLLGWFGGYGFDSTMQFFTEGVGLPWLIGFLVIILESIGAIALIKGIGTRFFALAYIFLALGMIFTSHLDNGFFMNWFGNQDGEGYEYFILWIGMASALLISGGGIHSIDSLLYKRTI